MRTRLGRTGLTLLGIILGVAVVLAIQITNQSTLASINRVFDRAAGKATLMVIPVTGGGEVLDETILPRIEGMDQVQVAAPSVRENSILTAEAESWQIDLSVTGTSAVGNLLNIYGVIFPLDSEVRVYELAEGRLPEAEAYETMIPTEYAKEKGLDIGDDLVFLIPGGIERLKITGTLTEEGVGLINDGVVAFAPLRVIQDIFDRGGELDEIAIRTEAGLDAAPQAFESFKNKVEDRVGSEGRVIYPAARGQLVTRMLATYQQGLSFFSMIAIFVGAFLIYNTFSMTIVERTREIGMLRAIGMSRRKVLRMVLVEAGILSLIGSALGLGAGVLLARVLMVLMDAIITTGENLFTVSWEGIVQSLGVGIGVTLGAALLPAYQAANTSPMGALRVQVRAGERVRPTIWISGLMLVFVAWAMMYEVEWRPSVRFATGSTAILLMMLGATLTVPLIVNLLERSTRPLAKIIYGNEGMIGSANVRRSIGRTTLTVASLMVALAMIIGVGSLAHSFEIDMSAWIETALGGDLYVRSPLVMRESFARQLENIPGVEAVTPARYLRVRVAPESMPRDLQEDDTLIYMAIDPDTYRDVAQMEFTTGQGEPEKNWARLANGNAIFISTVVADRFNLEQNDKLTLMTHRGGHEFTVAGVMVDFTGQGYTITGSYNDMKRWFSESGSDRFTIKINSNYPTANVAGKIETRYQSRRNISVQTNEAFQESITVLMDQAFNLFDVLNLIGVIIGALGVTNTLTMNVIERRREIGGLRSLGMTRSQVLQMVLAEALALGTMGGVYGLGFGYVIAQILVMGMNMLNGYELEFIFTTQPFLIGAVIALVVAQGAALLPARRAARVNIVEAIKHE
jgi:putative ABC transport system permease protein